MKPMSVTRAELAHAVSRAAGLPRAEALSLVEAVLSEIGDCLAKGEAVKVSGFGAVAPRPSGRRKGRNPKTGHEVTIEPQTVIAFKASNVLIARLNRAPCQMAAE
jgi:integration host factor subunit alpha